MLTALLLITCIIAFLWGLNTMSEKSEAGPLEWFAVTLSPFIGLGALFSSCWQAALALLVLLLVGSVVVCTIGALFSGGGAGQLGKVILVIGALVIALPPFWPIAIPLAICLVGANLLLAPVMLLGSTIRNFLDGGN